MTQFNFSGVSSVLSQDILHVNDIYCSPYPPIPDTFQKQNGCDKYPKCWHVCDLKLMRPEILIAVGMFISCNRQLLSHKILDKILIISPSFQIEFSDAFCEHSKTTDPVCFLDIRLRRKSDAETERFCSPFRHIFKKLYAMHVIRTW